MISGAHIVIHSRDADADRAFFRDVLELGTVDAGHGWLIFALPPAEAAFHPADADEGHQLHLMCDDLPAEMARLAQRGVPCSDVLQARWGSITRMTLPGGGKLSLYQPRHARPHG